MNWVLSKPSNKSAFTAYEAVKLLTTPSVTANDPLILTRPVNSWVLELKVPNLVEPVTKSTLDVIVWTTIFCAVKVPLTVKLSAEEAVTAVVAVAAFPEIEALINDLFSHLAAVVSYAKGCPLVGPDINTSDKPARVCVIIEPPPPEPPTDLTIETSLVTIV